MAARDLYEAINQVQDEVRFLNDAGRRMDEDAMRGIIYALGKLTNIVEALVRDEDVPTVKGQRIE
ncbi:hypothetical protein [Curtobacterium sp. MWU13-2055]|uniref:hypothetical protein n=1 Tax=Curtobacterium sp. MWU13-2055 TaxID=2931928 RepID=UPI00200BB4E3|nr:hypothetical protein [Curtobacterium sp. MWU13-2055]